MFDARVGASAIAQAGTWSLADFHPLKQYPNPACFKPSPDYKL